MNAFVTCICKYLAGNLNICDINSSCYNFKCVLHTCLFHNAVTCVFITRGSVHFSSSHPETEIQGRQRAKSGIFLIYLHIG